MESRMGFCDVQILKTNALEEERASDGISRKIANSKLCGGSVFKPKHPSKNLVWRAESWYRSSLFDKQHRNSKNFSTKKEAVAWLQLQLKKYEQRATSADPEITVAEWFGNSLKTFFINLRPNTRTSYEGYLRNHVMKHPLAMIKLVDLNVCDLQNFENELLTNLNSKTVRSIMLAIRKSLRFAVGAGIIDKNPADFVVLPGIKKVDVEYLRLDEIKSLTRFSKNEDWGIFFPLGFLTACRLGELAALRNSSLISEDGKYFISVDGSLGRIKNYSPEAKTETVLCIGPTKNGKSRKVPILPELAHMIEQHFKRQQQLAIKIYGREVENPFMFSVDGGLHFVDPATIRIWSQKIADKARLGKHFTPHMLRRSLATIGTTTAHIDLCQMAGILGNGVNVCAEHYISSDSVTQAFALSQLEPICKGLFQ